MLNETKTEKDSAEEPSSLSMEHCIRSRRHAKTMTKLHLVCSFDQAQPSQHRGLHTQLGNNQSTHTETQCEDIPGMLLFDSDLLCVDGLIDADSL